ARNVLGLRRKPIAPIPHHRYPADRPLDVQIRGDQGGWPAARGGDPLAASLAAAVDGVLEVRAAEVLRAAALAVRRERQPAPVDVERAGAPSQDVARDARFAERLAHEEPWFDRFERGAVAGPSLGFGGGRRGD